MAGPYYVRSTDGDDASDGSTWALAKATLAGAFAVAAAGDVIYVSDNHAETQASAMTLTSPGTAAAPCRVLCVDDAAEPPTALATTATITTTGTNGMSLAGFAYCYGITFSCGTGTGDTDLSFTSASPFGWTCEACKLAIGATHTSGAVQIEANANANRDDRYVILKNTKMKFGGTAQGVQLMGARFEWYDTPTAIDTSVATPATSLFRSLTGGASGVAIIAGVDLSAITAGGLVNTASATPYDIYFRNCKLGAAVPIITGTIPGPGGMRVYLDNCDSGDTNYRMEHYKYQGSIVTNTSIYRSASDGTTSYSWKMVSLATGPTYTQPLESPPIILWNETTGSAITLTVEIVHDSATNLENDEIWLEVEYLGTSGFPVSSFATDRHDHHIVSIVSGTGNGDAQTASAVAWTGTGGFTNENKQKLDVSVTPREKGPITCKVMLAKANYTVYIDPKVDVT